MTRKDYELIATVIRQFEPGIREKMGRLFVGRLGNENPRFDSIKFLQACNIDIIIKGDYYIYAND
jgi:hypothetical protein